MTWFMSNSAAAHERIFLQTPRMTTSPLRTVPVCMKLSSSALMEAAWRNVFWGHSLISFGTGARPLIVFGAVNVRAVVEGPVPSADGSAAPLVQEVPVETGERSVLCTFMLDEQGALLRSELFQVSEEEADRETSSSPWTAWLHAHFRFCSVYKNTTLLQFDVRIETEIAQRWSTEIWDMRVQI